MKTLSVVMLAFLVALAVPDAAVLRGQTSTAPRPPLAPLSARLEKERDNEALQKVAPFKVFDNLYYVGVGWVASWLVSTSDGLILIDTLEPRYVDHLIDGVARLGFDPKDIKHVIVLQAHADHLGGAELMQQKYGATIWMGEEDWPGKHRVIKDGDTLSLGTTTLKLYATPGHTPGTTSIDMTVYDAGKPYRAFFFGGSAPAPGPRAAEQFLATVKRLQTLQQGVQVRLVNHPFSDPEFWSRVDRLTTRKPGDPHPFVAPDVFPAWLQQLEASTKVTISSPASSNR